MADVENKLIELEKKYLKGALKECRRCFDMVVTDSCTDKCSSRYVRFMQLKHFFLKNKKTTMDQLKTIQTIVDSIEVTESS